MSEIKELIITKGEKDEKIDLKEATRNELITELKERVSVSSVQIPKNEGATIQHSRGKISVSGEASIFVLKPN